jgi:hypothetical protein
VLLCEGIEAMEMADRSKTSSLNAPLDWTLALTASVRHKHPTSRG